jgi:hypothetical protein
MVELDESIDELEESEEDIEEDICEEDDGEESEESDEDEDPQVYEKLQTTTNDLNDIYRDGVAVAKELKGAYDDIAAMFDFKNWLK